MTRVKAEATFGSCVAIDPVCEGQAEGEAFCDGTDAVVCSDAGIEVDREACELSCEKGICVEGDGCDESTTADCVGDCGGDPAEACMNPPGELPHVHGLLESTFRITGSNAAAGFAGNGCDESAFGFPWAFAESPVRVTIGAGWRMVPYESGDNLCELESFRSCVILPGSPGEIGIAFIPDEGAPPPQCAPGNRPRRDQLSIVSRSEK